MLFPFLLLALPLIEIAGFVLIGGRIGVGWTLGLTFASALLGLTVLRFQLASLPERARRTFPRDEPPVAEAVLELARVFAGVLLILPGFVTDAIGLLLLIKPVRLLAVWLLLAWLARHAGRGGGGSLVIEGDFTDVTPGGGGDRRR